MLEPPTAGARAQVLASADLVRLSEQAVHVVGESLAELSTVHTAPGWDSYRTVGAA
jgi:hypothetical protein